MLETINKKIKESVQLKDRMIEINDKLKGGQYEDEAVMTTAELKLREEEGNYTFIKNIDGKFVKLFSWELIKRTIERIKELRGLAVEKEFNIFDKINVLERENNGLRETSKDLLKACRKANRYFKKRNLGENAERLEMYLKNIITKAEKGE